MSEFNRDSDQPSNTHMMSMVGSNEDDDIFQDIIDTIPSYYNNTTANPSQTHIHSEKTTPDDSSSDVVFSPSTNQPHPYYPHHTNAANTTASAYPTHIGSNHTGENASTKRLTGAIPTSPSYDASLFANLQLHDNVNSSQGSTISAPHHHTHSHPSHPHPHPHLPTTTTSRRTPSTAHRRIRASATSLSSYEGTHSNQPSYDATQSPVPGNRMLLNKARADGLVGKSRGFSCHQCKSTKPRNILLFCSSQGARGEKRRACRKKYCEQCLNRTYHTSITHLSREEVAVWQCPSCTGLCVCKSCTRKYHQYGKPVADQFGIYTLPSVLYGENWREILNINTPGGTSNSTHENDDDDVEEDEEGDGDVDLDDHSSAYTSSALPSGTHSPALLAKRQSGVSVRSVSGQGSKYNSPALSGKLHHPQQHSHSNSHTPHHPSSRSISTSAVAMQHHQPQHQHSGSSDMPLPPVYGSHPWTRHSSDMMHPSQTRPLSISSPARVSEAHSRDYTHDLSIASSTASPGRAEDSTVSSSDSHPYSTHARHSPSVRNAENISDDHYNKHTHQNNFLNAITTLQNSPATLRSPLQLREAVQSSSDHTNDSGNVNGRHLFEYTTTQPTTNYMNQSMLSYPTSQSIHSINTQTHAQMHPIQLAAPSDINTPRSENDVPYRMMDSDEVGSSATNEYLYVTRVQSEPTAESPSKRLRDINNNILVSGSLICNNSSMHVNANGELHSEEVTLGDGAGNISEKENVNFQHNSSKLPFDPLLSVNSSRLESQHLPPPSGFTSRATSLFNIHALTGTASSLYFLPPVHAGTRANTATTNTTLPFQYTFDAFNFYAPVSAPASSTGSVHDSTLLLHNNIESSVINRSGSDAAMSSGKETITNSTSF